MPKDPYELIGEVFVDAGTHAFWLGRYLYRKRVERRALLHAEQKAAENERASREQRREWLRMVEQQMSRGRAGFATEEETRAALSGKGGRPSKLDDRKF
jgi:hypothetical protein